jgi:hypothetical protein
MGANLMSHSLSKFVAGALALAFAGGAMANVTLDGSTTGDVFLNIVDTTNNTSYLYDTGVSFTSFNGNGGYTFDLSGDTNLTGFLNTSDAFYYSVEAGTNVGGNQVYATGNVAPSANTSTKTGTARGAIGTFLSQAGTVSSTSTTSVVLTGTYSWNQGGNEGVVSKNIFANANTPYSDQAALNTALNFYNVSGATATQTAYQWNFSTSNDTLTYGSGSAVPLPTPILLLGSALGLMGVVARRNKAVA